MRHVDNCDLTIQAVANAKPAFVDVAHKLRKRYSNISQIHWNDDLSFGRIAVRWSVSIVASQLLLSIC